MDTDTYTINQLYQRIKAEGERISRETVTHILADVPEDGKDNRGYKLFKWDTWLSAKETYDEAKAEMANTRVAGGHVDETLLGFTRECKRLECVRRQRVEDEANGKLILREDVIEYLLGHQTAVCNVLRKYLLSQLPAELAEPKIREAMLIMYNEIVTQLVKELGDFITNDKS